MCRFRIVRIVVLRREIYHSSEISACIFCLPIFEQPSTSVKIITWFTWSDQLNDLIYRLNCLYEPAFHAKQIGFKTDGSRITRVRTKVSQTSAQRFLGIATLKVTLSLSEQILS